MAEEDEENDSNLELQNELKPVGDYVNDRTQLVEQIFLSIGRPQIKRMLPDILKVRVSVVTPSE